MVRVDAHKLVSGLDLGESDAGVRLWWKGRKEPRDGGRVQATQCDVAIPARRDDRTRSGEARGEWTNRLFWGANRVCMAWLERGGILSRVGGAALIYIDPPFAVDAEFRVEAAEGVRRGGRGKGEGFAFSDSWDG